MPYSPYPHPVLASVVNSLRELEKDKQLLSDVSETIYSGGDWPPVVGCPLERVFALLHKHGYGSMPFSSALLMGSVVSALGTWRLTKGAYFFDKSIWPHIQATPLARLPHGLLQRLPETAPLLVFPTPLIWEGQLIDAAHAYMDYDLRHEPHLELRFLCWVREGEQHKQISLILNLDADSLDDCLERTVMRTIQELASLPADLAQIVLASRASMRQVLTSLINATLYLCQEEPDLSGAPRPRPPRPSRMARLRKPDKPRVIEVGWRWGAGLRAYQARQEKDSGNTPTGRTVQPHVRRAHWHLYWTGKGSRKDSSKAVPQLRWIGAVLVGGDEIDQVTVRQV